MIILFALVRCGGKGTHGRIIDFILDNHFMSPREGDEAIRSNGQKAIINDLEYARQDLKDRGLLSMPQYGMWAITDDGKKLIIKIARKLLAERPLWDKALADGQFRRIGKPFLDAMESYAKNLLSEESEK